jgi:hypothetical protein
MHISVKINFYILNYNVEVYFAFNIILSLFAKSACLFIHSLDFF